MTIEELTLAWRWWGSGIGDMYRIRKSILKNINLPEETKLFLNQAGLCDALYNYTKLPNLPRLTELVSRTGLLPSSFARYRVLGEHGYKSFHCLDEEEEGRVIVVYADPESESGVIFANSSILKYAECFVATGKIWDEIDRDNVISSSPTWPEYVAKYEQAIQEIDPAALAEEYNWWSSRVEGMKAGIY